MTEAEKERVAASSRNARRKAASAAVKPCPFCEGEGRIEGSTLSELCWPMWDHLDACPMKGSARMWNSVDAAVEAGNMRPLSHKAKDTDHG